MAVLPTGIGPVTGGYQIERSLRFNSADSAYLNRTPASTTNRRTYTISAWVKRSVLGTYQYIITAFNASTNECQIRFNSDNTLEIAQYTSPSYNYQLVTTQVFRDASAWYHVVVAVDTTQATSSNRIKLYVNGTQVTVFSTASYPSLNYDTNFNLASYTNQIGAWNTSNFYNGYMTEIYMIDGQALTPSSFGETDANTGVWKPKAFSGTYGTNGFYLKFADNSNTTAATLGKDSSGNGNNWTPNNFSVTAGAGNDSLVDSPTSYGTDTGAGGSVRGNYCTLNPLDEPATYAAAGSSANGNLDFSVSNDAAMGSTISVSSGKWYWEMTVVSGHSSGSNTVWTAITSITPSSSNKLAWQAGSGSRSYATTGLKYNENTNASYGNTYTNGDVIGCALDLDNGKVYWSKNGTFQASGDPVAGTNAAYTGLTGSWMPEATQNGAVTAWNFGQRAFAYTAPSGFKALCTQNLPTPTIGATSTTQANDYFNAVLYTGTGASLGVTGVGFQPDLVWIKCRSNARDHKLTDAVRGATKAWSSNDRTTGESTDANGLTAFNSDGFTVGTDAVYNTSTNTYVAWNWKANGSGSSNTAGTISSTVSVNTTASCSIVKYAGNGSSGATVGHGLGVAPNMIIVKRLDLNGASTPDSIVYHVSIGNTKGLVLDLTDAETTATGFWNNTTPSSTVFTVGNDANTNRNTNNYIAYCFAAVAGYSAFGSYTGTGNTDGPFVYTGFRPRFVLTKQSSSTSNWSIHDTSRAPYNLTINNLYPDVSDAEYTGTNESFDFLSNGFKPRAAGTSTNASGGTYIYMAFAEAPFKYSLAR